MLVGEAPGADEVTEGRPFVGASGKKLRAALTELGLDADSTYITNVVKIRPPNNRTPKPEEISDFLDLLRAEIHEIRPKRILALGNIAFQTLTGSTMGVTLYRGFWQKLNLERFGHDWDCLVMPTWHPAYLLYNRRNTPIWERDLAEFVARTKED